ncbi:polysaccharide deacetylase [Enemella dayhoffiae]|uniref:Polysaccharide deacetylase n=1 Tax=Enemella dayhoffiae TaxID=2016507 RepID=A0A255HB64_9ACTN|nr:polysaccharide deacetylase family protein [Enemella dayhoffiae]OYO25168.1 polysaccharide deacetylase [Enemella dayhoffiae]
MNGRQRPALTRLAAAAAGVTALIGLAACGTPPPDTGAAPSAGGSARPSSAPTTTAASPTPTPSPTPTVDQTALKPGTNHNHAAAAYAYQAKDVQACLRAKPGEAACPISKKVVFLTFDDGPTDSTTPKVLDILKEKGVHGSFFVIVGPQGMEKANPQLVKREIAEGHSIVIHSYSHSYGLLYPGGRANAQNIMGDYDKALAGIRKQLGNDYAVRGFRYPGGHGWKGLEASDQALAQREAYWMDWNSNNGDGESKSAPGSGSAAAERVKSTHRASGLPNVAVVLMHDYKDNALTTGGLAEVIDFFKDQGYEFGVVN